jgi:hypothetical protein
MLKNNKIKKSEVGSDITTHRRGKNVGLNISPTTDDQTPKPNSLLRANPGGAIYLFDHFRGFLKNLTDTTMWHSPDGVLGILVIY